MKRLSIILFSLLFSVTTYSQGVDFGIKFGANFANISDASGLDNKTGFHAGAFAALKFNDKVALQGELLYSQQGAKFSPGDFNLDYVNVPVIVKYYLVQGLNIQLGPQFGFLVDDNINAG
ncbi:outer membrane beta-barrel protein, partial [Paucihalobacter sp.]|uniref:outer membrane beta-barrel protein n=1 Tax=Paucihalobacter sp. TaxID=2850405 RepID=UPI003D160396